MIAADAWTLVSALTARAQRQRDSFQYSWIRRRTYVSVKPSSSGRTQTAFAKECPGAAALKLGEKIIQAVRRPETDVVLVQWLNRGPVEPRT
jgi:hypothetical protein